MLRALDNAAPLSATTVDDEVAPKVTQTLDFVLAQIQQSGVALNWGRRGRFALARRLRKELAGYGVEIADPTVIDLVAMVDRLFDGIVTDRYLNPVARGRICALALPVLRIALGDATFFASDAHPARTTINLTARIAAYHGSADSSEQEIGQRAEDVIRDLLARPTCCSGAFAQTNEALEPLLDAQRQLREQRITALLAKLGQADRTRAPAENGPETAPGEDEHDATWRSLELLVSRLAVGDWMLVTNADGKSRCARLEWFSPGRTHVGLADELGHEVTTLECAGLIDAAMSGDIVIADEISMPLTERAMYGVLQSLHHDIRLKATVDPATGTANRRHLESEIVRLMRVPPRRKRSHYACWIGIDTYTTTLQQHGDTTAARLEKQYAASLRRQLGSEAVLGRIEKGAFLAVIADQSDAHMQQLTRQLQRAARLSKCTLRGEDIDFGISIGVTRLPEEVSDVDRFLNRANEAYTAARGTEDRIFLAPAPATDRHAGSPQILQLIESGALSLRCQKILPIDNARALPYYEVLLGVRAPDGSINPPGNVIQMAEACGDICELDRWVVNTALTTMQANPDWLGTIDGLSINLSGTSLSNRELLEYITGAVAGSGVPAAKIIFEITESATITQLEIAQNFVTTLRETGCRFALDDFGAAHASYSYLKLLPVDTIKIDGLFISDITNSPADEAMVRSMADIARVLGKKTVAEFVGDAATFELMRDIGIDYGQGFWIEKPRPIEEAIACSATGGPE